MKGKNLKIFLISMMVISISACSGYQERTLDYLGKRPTTGAFFKEDNTPLAKLNYDAANEIANQLEERLPPGSPITVTMFRMRGSKLQTDFAKILTEQVASKIAQEGFAIVADSSRFPTTALDEGLAPPEKCVLAGAYTVGPEIISITAAISTISDGEILGSYDWTVPLNSKTRALLPIKESPFIEPMVNTSGPIIKSENSGQNFNSQYDQDSQNHAPGFEQNILD